jgi:hypothetical protein
MSKLFVKFLFVVMATVMIVTACGTSTNTPPAYDNPTNPPAYQDDTAVPATNPAASETAVATEAATATEPATTGEVSFAANILPILQKSCVNCHGGNRTEKGLDLNSYQGVMAGSSRGPVIVAGDAEHSSLVTAIQSGKMPKRGAKLTAEEVQLFIDWVMAGALNN